MIEHTKKLVEEKFTTLGGYDHNAEACPSLYFFSFGVFYPSFG